MNKFKKILFINILSLLLLFTCSVNFFALESTISYKGEKDFYKNASSILLTNQIIDFVRPNFICEENYNITVITDNYIGNGATVGKYDLTLKATSESNLECTIIVTIHVISGLKIDYMYNNDFYCYTSSNLTKLDLVETCKKLEIIPDVPTNANVTSNYFTTPTEADFYELNITYISATGYSGSIDGRIICSETAGMELTDVVQVNSGDELLTIVIVILSISVVFLSIRIINKKSKKRLRKFE